MAQAAYSKKVDALVPGGGEGVDLPDSIADAWGSLKTHRESPSSIVSFLECPLKWFAERHLESLYKETGDTILGLTKFDRPPPNQYAVGGTLVHRCLEVFYSEPPHLRTEEWLKEIFTFAWDSLRRGEWQDGIVSKSMVADFDAMLANVDDPSRFKQRFASQYRDSTMAILEMERPERVRVKGNETMIRTSVGRMSIFGKIDREDHTTNGTVKIIDYKTGKSPDGEITVFNKTFLPAGIYALARTEETEDDISAREIVGVQLKYLKDLRNCSIRTTPEVLDDVRDILDMVDGEMDAIAESGVVPTAPAQSLNEMPCKWCPLRDLCPEWN